MAAASDPSAGLLLERLGRLAPDGRAAVKAAFGLIRTKALECTIAAQVLRVKRHAATTRAHKTVRHSTCCCLALCNYAPAHPLRPPSNFVCTAHNAFNLSVQGELVSVDAAEKVRRSGTHAAAREVQAEAAQSSTALPPSACSKRGGCPVDLPPRFGLAPQEPATS